MPGWNGSESTFRDETKPRSKYPKRVRHIEPTPPLMPFPLRDAYHRAPYLMAQSHASHQSCPTSWRQTCGLSLLYLAMLRSKAQLPPRSSSQWHSINLQRHVRVRTTHMNHAKLPLETATRLEVLYMPKPSLQLGALRSFHHLTKYW